MNSDEIAKMLKQENECYAKHFYLEPIDPTSGCDGLERTGEDDIVRSSSSTCVRVVRPFVDSSDRRIMIEWCYQVFDHCNFHRENIEYVASYLDRFCYNSDQVQRNDRTWFQLCTLACLYITIKIHEAEVMHPRTLSRLSRYIFSVESISDMELRILSSLQWKMNPPTSMLFVRNLLQSLEEENIIVIHEKRHPIYYETIQYQTEVAIVEYPLLPTKPSVISYCSILNALEIHSDLPYTKYQLIVKYLAKQVGIIPDDPKVSTVQKFLRAKTLVKYKPDPIKSNNLQNCSSMTTVVQSSDPATDKSHRNSQTSTLCFEEEVDDVIFASPRCSRLRREENDVKCPVELSNEL